MACTSTCTKWSKFKIFFSSSCFFLGFLDLLEHEGIQFQHLYWTTFLNWTTTMESSDSKWMLKWSNCFLLIVVLHPFFITYTIDKMWILSHNDSYSNKMHLSSSFYNWYMMFSFKKMKDQWMVTYSMVLLSWMFKSWISSAWHLKLTSYNLHMFTNSRLPSFINTLEWWFLTF